VTESDLFVGGRVFTGRGYEEALLIEDGEVLVAGSEREARGAASAGTRVHPLAGGLVLPGLIDAHFHVASVTRVREGLDLGAVRELEGLAGLVREWAATHPGPVVGRGWDPERSASHAWPNAHALDRVVPDRPLAIVHASGHAMIVNTVLLEQAGFDARTPDPPGGRFGRKPDGSPDGRLYESAIPLLESKVAYQETPDPAALRRTLQWAAEFGLTTIGAMSVVPEEALGLRELAASRTLPGRVRIYLLARRWQEYYRKPAGPQGPPGRFAVLGVKEFTDGAFGPHTAWLSEPYADDPSTSGLPVAGEEELRPLFEEIAKRRLVPALHAIGDRAVAYALGMLDTFPILPGPTPRIEHAALTPPELIEILSRARPTLVVQPGFNWSDAWLGARLGPERVRWAYAFRTLTERGLALVGSSDAPYDPADPWRGLYAAIRRTAPDGRSANPEPREALAPERAVALYTANAGPAFGEPNLGILEPGSPADLVVVGAPTLAQAIEAGSAAVRATWVAGKVVAHGPGSSEAQRV
jgi:predicted amidohydrolase YtcJ